MARNLRKQQYDNMMKNNSGIRMLSQLEADKLRMEIDELKKEIEEGDLSEKTKNRLNELEESLNVKLSLAYDRD